MLKYLLCLNIITLIILQSCTTGVESKIDNFLKWYTDKDLFSGVVLYAEGGKITQTADTLHLASVSIQADTKVFRMIPINTPSQPQAPHTHTFRLFLQFI